MISINITPREGAIILLLALASVGGVFLFACLSIFIVYIFKTIFSYILYTLWLITEIIVALIAAVTSGATVTLSILVAAGVSTTTLPPHFIEGRIGVTIAVASAGIVSASYALVSLASIELNVEIAASIIGAAAISVGCAAAWAVGVMSLIERETQHAGLKMTSILDTVRHNNYRVLRFLIKLHLGVQQQELNLGLLHAVKSGFPECTDILLNNGAHPDARDFQENSALSLACESGSYRIARMLLDKGANVNARNGNYGTALGNSAKWGYEDCVQLLLSRGADPNLQDGQWRIPLMLAAGHAHKADRIMRMLIDAGSYINVYGTNGRSAIHYAAARGHVSDVTLLLENHANAWKYDMEGDGCLHLAAREGCADVIGLFIEAGCDIDAKNNLNRSPLHLAATRGHMRTTRLLVEAGSDINLPDNNGNTAIWYAASHGFSKTVQYFVSRNAHLRSFHTKDKEYISISNPLAAALEKNHFSAVKVLVLAGCDTAPLVEWFNNLPPDFKADYNSMTYIDWCKQYLSQPPCLTHLCRLKIRQCIGEDFAGKEKHVPLPSILQNYLLMQDADEEPVLQGSPDTGLFGNLAMDILQGFPNMYT